MEEDRRISGFPIGPETEYHQEMDRMQRDGRRR